MLNRISGCLQQFLFPNYSWVFRCMFKINNLVPKALLILICFCVLQNAKADIVIEYVVYVEQENPLVDKSLLVPERITVAFNGKFARVQSISGSGFGSHFDRYKFGENFYYVCLDFFGQKKAFKTKKKSYTIDYPHDSVYNIDGYPCRKAYGKDESTETEVEIYYTDNFGVHFFPYGELKGVALKYTITDKFFKSITFKVVSMQAGSLPDNMFSIAGFKISSPSTAQKKHDTWVGKKLPALKARDLNGAEYSIELAGKITVVNYWFLGCAPCRREIPYLNEIVKKYENKTEIQFIAIALDKPEALAKFFEEGNIFNYQLLADGRKAATKGKVTSYPTHFIIDRTGHVIDEWHKYTPMTILEISERIDELIKK